MSRGHQPMRPSSTARELYSMYARRRYIVIARVDCSACLYDHAYTQSPFGPFVQVVARARCCESMTRGGLRAPTTSLSSNDSRTAKSTSRMVRRSTSLAVPRSSLTTSSRTNLVSCGSVGHIHALLAPPAYVHGIVLHSPSSTGQSRTTLERQSRPHVWFGARHLWRFPGQV
jgi:hypothetical protein